MTVHHFNTAASTDRFHAMSKADMAARIVAVLLAVTLIAVICGGGIFAVTRTTQFLSAHIKIIVQ